MAKKKVSVGKRKLFAILDAQRKYINVVSSRDITKVEEEYPDNTVVDVTGNPPPKKPGRPLTDLTLTTEDVWEWAKTDQEYDTDAAAKKKLALQRSLCTVKVLKDKATSEGFTDLVTKLTSDETKIQAKIDAL